MLKEIILIIVSCVSTAVLTVVISEWRFKIRQRKTLISQIADKYVKLRSTESEDSIHELWHLQFSGILLLKREQDAKEVLRQIKCIGFPIDIPNFMKKKGILNGLEEAIDSDVNLKDFRDVTIKQIGEALESEDYNL